MFKREVADDAILEDFIKSHSLNYDSQTIAEFKLFAETSFESPIDFKQIILKLQKRNRKSLKEEMKLKREYEETESPEARVVRGMLSLLINLIIRVLFCIEINCHR